MFALLVPPRPLLAPQQMQTISPTQSAYTFSAAPSFSHLAIFALPDASLPPNHLAAIYIQLPGANDFTLLGALGPEKQSAIFRVKAGRSGVGQQWEEGRIVGEVGGIAEVDMDAGGADGAGPSAGPSQGDVVVGISIEPLEQLAPQLQALAARQAGAQGQAGNGSSMALYNRNQQGASGTPSTKTLAQRIIKNAFNFLASFEGGDGKVPLKSFENWWKKFETRISNDPGFLERDEQD